MVVQDYLYNSLNFPMFESSHEKVGEKILAEKTSFDFNLVRKT